MHIYVYAYTYFYIYIVHLHLQIKCVSICTYIYMYTWKHIHVHRPVHISMYIYIDMCTYPYILSHTYTKAYRCVRTRRSDTRTCCSRRVPDGAAGQMWPRDVLLELRLHRSRESPGELARSLGALGGAFGRAITFLNMQAEVSTKMPS